MNTIVHNNNEGERQWLRYVTLMWGREKSGDLMKSLNIRKLRKKTLALRKTICNFTAPRGSSTSVLVGSAILIPLPAAVLFQGWVHSRGSAFRKIGANGKRPSQNDIRSGNCIPGT